MRRQEIDRGEMAVKYRREGNSPENSNGESRWLQRIRRLRCGRRLGESAALTRGLRPHRDRRPERTVTMEILTRAPMERCTPLTSLKAEEEAMHARKSEFPIVAAKPGNSGGAKGGQYWDSESMANMSRHRADSAHDH
jgi:hypothetical protein